MRFRGVGAYLPQVVQQLSSVSRSAIIHCLSYTLRGNPVHLETYRQLLDAEYMSQRVLTGLQPRDLSYCIVMVNHEETVSDILTDLVSQVECHPGE